MFLQTQNGSKNGKEKSTYILKISGFQTDVLHEV